MTVPVGVSRCTRLLSAVVLGVGMALGVAACGSAESDTSSSSSPAPVAGQKENRLQLTEGVPQEMLAGEEQATSVELTRSTDGGEPAVVIRVSPPDGSPKEHEVSLGDDVAIDGDTWRVSEIGLSDAQPASATLTRDTE